MPPIIYVPIGIHGYIRCPVEAEPPVTLVKWNKDGRPLRIEKVTKPPGRGGEGRWGHRGVRPLTSSANSSEHQQAPCGSLSVGRGGTRDSAFPYQLWAELIPVLV